MNYRIYVRELIRLDHERLRSSKEGALRLEATTPSFDEQFYVVDYIKKYLDDAIDENTHFGHIDITRDNIARKHGLKRHDDLVIHALIDYIDMHWEGDYREVVDAYLTGSISEDEFVENGETENTGKAHEDRVGNRSEEGERQAAPVHDPIDSPVEQDQAPLSASLRAFGYVCDCVLLFPAFSPKVLSLHFAFATFYTFMALAITWAISGISDIGDVPILPTNTNAAAARAAEFDIAGIVENRLFVLSVVLIIVLIFVVGFIAALTAKDFLARLTKNDILMSASAASASGIALWYSGMHEAFAVLFSVMMSVSIIMAGRLDRRTLAWATYPVAFMLNISLIVVIGEVLGSIQAAGGVLPALSLLTLVIGAASQGRHGSVIAACVTLISCLIFAVLNIAVFKSWFRIDPWDPGTVVIFLLIPMVNGIWDWVSTSTTRWLTTGALLATENRDRRSALMIYVAFVLVDLIIAFATIIGLYLLLYHSLIGYNHVAFDGDQRVSLDAYFQGFEEGLFSERAVLVIIMLLTVLVPTILHVHLVSRVLISTGGRGVLWAGFAYLAAMIISVVFLLNTARGILRFILE